MTELLGALISLSWLLWLAFGCMIFLALPLMAWSVTRNVKLMRMQFERLNDSLDARASERHTGTFGR